jgi:Flp pilus assembly protein TadB
MSESPSRPTFGQIYQQQYRQVSSSKTSRAFRIISPVVLLICAVFLRHSPVVSITLGAVAVLLVAGVIVWSRMHRHGSTPTSSPR